MDTARKQESSVGLEQLRLRFERYRRTCKVRTRIPDELWDAAAKTAARFGIHRTCKVLRLNYYDLKKRVEKKAPAPLATSKPKASRFIELLAPAGNGGQFEHGQQTMPSVQAFRPSGSCDCTVELDTAGGDKMRIRLQCMDMPDLAELCRSFWSRRS